MPPLPKARGWSGWTNKPKKFPLAHYLGKNWDNGELERCIEASIQQKKRRYVSGEIARHICVSILGAIIAIIFYCILLWLAFSR